MFWKPMEKNNNTICSQCRGLLIPIKTWWHNGLYEVEGDDLYLCNVKYARYKCQKCGFEPIRVVCTKKIRKADINEIIDD